MRGTKFFSLKIFNEENLRSGLRIGIGIFLIMPFIIWLGVVRDWSGLASMEWLGPLMRSLLQASLSTICTLIWGFILFRSAAAGATGGWRALGEGALLLPNLVPPLLLATSLIVGAHALALPAYGFHSVVLAHSILNGGLVAVALERLVQGRLLSLMEAAWVMGEQPFLFIRRVAWPILKPELLGLLLFVFSLSLMSYSLPLLLSGQRITTLEVAIYDSIRVEGRWDKALALAALQTLALFLFALRLPSVNFSLNSPTRPLTFLGWRRLRWLPLLPAGLFLFDWCQGFVHGLSHWQEVRAVLPELFMASLNSLALGLAVGLLVLVLLLLIAYVSPHRRLAQFLHGFSAPSAAMTGFALLMLPLDGEWRGFVLTALAITLVSLPALYRWLIHAVLANLQTQILVARGLGAHWRMILFEVVWPQSASVILRAAGVAGLWATGDFALSRILFKGSETLPLLLDDWLGNYQFAAAHFLVLPLLLLGIFVYASFARLGRYVAH